MPDSNDNSSDNDLKKFTYHTNERNKLKLMSEKYKCSPFTGECYTEEISFHKVGQTYHIILSEQQMSQFGEDFIIEDTVGTSKHRSLIMIKPTSEDNNYIFFRRK